MIRHSQCLALFGSMLIALSLISSSPARALDEYVIEHAVDDEWLIINGEKYQAKTYCLGWEKDERVVFVEGSAYGACASATLLNLDREESCEVWCE